MPQQIGWSVEAKLLYEIKQLTKSLSSRSYIQTFPNFASFPTPGITGTLYVDEATGDIYVWNGTSYVLLSSGITALNGLIAAAQLFATGSTGTDFNISSVGTTHTFNIPTASATNRGLLSSADWTTFNSKIGGTGTTNYVSKFTGAGTLGNSQIFDNGTNVGIGTTSPTAKLYVGDPSTASDITLESANTGSYKLNTFGVLRARFSAVVGGAYFGTESGQGFMDIGASGSIRMRLFANGRVGVNTTTDAGYQLDVNGSARVNSSTFFQTNSSSDVFFDQVPNANNSAVIRQTRGSQIFWTGVGANANGNWNLYDATNTAFRLTMTTSGNFGIGTTTPNSSAVLHSFGNLLVSNGTGTNLASVQTGLNVFGGPDAITSTIPGVITLGANSSTINSTEVLGRVQFLSNDASANLTGIVGKIDLLSESTFTAGSANTAMTFHTNTGIAGTLTERMRITSAGDVLIGETSDPLSQANRTTIGINGTTDAMLGMRYGGNLIGYLWGLSGEFRVGALGPLVFQTGTFNERMRILNNGRVLVNTTTDAGYQFDVNGSFRASGVIRSQATVGSTNGYFQLDHAGTQTWKLGVFTDNTSTFSIGNDNGGTFASRYLNITNSGNIGIGTSSPTFKLDINSGTITNTLRTINTSTTANRVFFEATSGNVEQHFLYTANQDWVIGLDKSDASKFKISSADDLFASARLTITTAGNVGIGTTSPIAKLDVVGSINATTNYRFNNADFSQIAIVDPGGGFAGGYNLTLSGGTPQHAATGAAAGYYYSQELVRFFTNSSSATGTNIPERLRITGGGNVLIGTTTDTGEKFQVAGTARVTQSAFLATASGAVGIGTTSVNAGRNLQINGTATDSFIQLVTTTSGTTASDGFIIGVGNGTEAFLLNYENSPIKIFTGGNERMRISSAGDVGIGTAVPSAYAGFTTLSLNNATNGGLLAFQVNSTTNAYIYSTAAQATIATLTTIPLTFVTGSTEKMRITATGNVGIGNTNPRASVRPTLQIGTFATLWEQTSGAVNLAFGAYEGATNTYYYNTTGDAPTMYMQLSGTHRWFNAAAGTADAAFTFTERMRITSAGNVGIGSTNPGRLLVIDGQASGGVLQITNNTAGNAAGNGLELVSSGLDGSIAVRNNGYLNIATNNTERIRITNGGNVLIGTTTDGGYKARIEGASSILQLVSNTSTCEIRLQNSVSANGFIAYFNSDLLFFANTGATSMANFYGATNSIGVLSGTAPTSSVTDRFLLYSADITAGNAAPHFRTENGAVVKVYQETTGVGAATLVGGGGTTITDTDTFDGYTLKQIVKALRNQGLLA